MKRTKKYFDYLFRHQKFIEDRLMVQLKHLANQNNYLSNNETDPTDIFIAAYPKSGNTWMQTLIACLQYGIDPQFITYPLVQEIVPDLTARSVYKKIGKPTFFKTHELPQPNYRKVIHLVRDGRDIMISYHRFLPLMQLNASLEDMIIKGKDLYPCKWHVYEDAWHKNPYDAEILIIRYEDLHTNGVETLQKICKFAGIERKVDWIEKIVKENTFQKMKARASSDKTLGHFMLNGEKASAFFRKGAIGSYKTEIPSKLLQFFENESREVLKRYGYLE